MRSARIDSGAHVGQKSTIGSPFGTTFLQCWHGEKPWTQPSYDVAQHLDDAFHDDVGHDVDKWWTEADPQQTSEPAFGSLSHRSVHEKDEETATGQQHWLQRACYAESRVSWQW